MGSRFAKMTFEWRLNVEIFDRPQTGTNLSSGDRTRVEMQNWELLEYR